MPRSTIKKIEDKVRVPALLKYPCKRGKGIHIFILKTEERYKQCKGVWRGLKCSSNVQEDGTCPKGLIRDKDQIFEEWRCINCNRKDVRIRYEDPK